MRLARCAGEERTRKRRKPEAEARVRGPAEDGGEPWEEAVRGSVEGRRLLGRRVLFWGH